MPTGWSSPLGRLLSRVGLGVLSCFIPPALVDEALAVAGRDEQRFRALPSRLGIYLVLALCLLRARSAAAVTQAMIPPAIVRRLAGLGWVLPTSTALTKLRDRLGVVPFQLLFTAMTRPVPALVRPWSHAFGLRVCAWDGTEITVDDTPANREHFRRHRGKNGPAGMPKARLLVLLACGTRQLLGAVIGGLGQGEVTLARQLVNSLRPGMLLLADRNFLGYPLWTAARARGTHLLWRAKLGKPLLSPRHPLPDGSWLATLHDPADARAWRNTVRRNRTRGHRPPKSRPIRGITVRVIEAWITVTVDGVTRTERYRLVTSLLDPGSAPADQLVALYARRWVAETGIRELKTVLLQGQPLRSRTPTRALQELWAALTTYQTIRLLISHAAHATDLDPSRISFTAARDTATDTITTTPQQARRHLEHTCQHLRRQLITRHTHHRTFPRALKNTLPRYPHNRKTRQLTSNKASYHITTTPTPTKQDTTTTPANPAQPRAA
ncbi:IS4 family transposase [Amycolatopsis sp. NPDC051071]|uniref:IS4 family transposase n=1 Tax=Amycolatopsis sp. NPDC051071 TaxID=3154637 RepID=UPI00341E06EE